MNPAAHVNDVRFQSAFHSGKVCLGGQSVISSDRGIHCGVGYFLPPLTDVLREAPALKEGALAALILISAPVAVLRPVRAARFFTEKVPILPG